MRMARSIRVQDLEDWLGMVGPKPFLYCCKCGAKYSADAGDYFMVSPEQVFRCCGCNLLLVVEKVALLEV